MILSKAQRKTLQDVADRKVRFVPSLSIKHTDFIAGARKDIIQKLMKWGLVSPPPMATKISWDDLHGYYTITEAGQQVLKMEDSI